MKQTSKYAIVFLAGAIFATAGSAYGAEAIKTISAKLRPDIKVSVNGKQLDASAISYNNTTYLPLRKAAEAVGGKIELNGKDINIVTQSSPIKSGSSNGNGSTESTTRTPDNQQAETYPIEGKVLYLWNDIYPVVYAKYESDIVGSVKNGNFIVSFNGNDYLKTRNVDFYYDLVYDKQYLAEDFLQKIFDTSILEGLKKYKVNVSTNTVIPI